MALKERYHPMRSIHLPFHIDAQSLLSELRRQDIILASCLTLPPSSVININSIKARLKSGLGSASWSGLYASFQKAIRVRGREVGVSLCTPPGLIPETKPYHSLD